MNILVFVRYKRKYINTVYTFTEGVESEIISTTKELYLQWRNHLVDKKDTEYMELIYSEVQLIKLKNKPGQLINDI